MQPGKTKNGLSSPPRSARPMGRMCGRCRCWRKRRAAFWSCHPRTLRIVQRRYKADSYAATAQERAVAPQAVETPLKWALEAHPHLKHLLPEKIRRQARGSVSASAWRGEERWGRGIEVGGQKREAHAKARRERMRPGAI